MGVTLTIAHSEQAGTLTAEELCHSYATSVCRFASLMSPTLADAEDVAQEALLRAVRSLRSYDNRRGSIEAWLWRIVVNAAKDSAGSRQRLRDIATRVRLLAPRETASVEDDVLRRLRDSDLHSHLRRLPLRDRTLIALRFGADLDMPAVAAAVGLSTESASRALRRALDRLRAQLEEAKP